MSLSLSTWSSKLTRRRLMFTWARQETRTKPYVCDAMPPKGRASEADSQRDKERDSERQRETERDRETDRDRERDRERQKRQKRETEYRPGADPIVLSCIPTHAIHERILNTNPPTPSTPPLPSSFHRRRCKGISKCDATVLLESLGDTTIHNDKRTTTKGRMVTYKTPTSCC